MSTTIDQRVVEMRFDNSQFEKGIQTSMRSLTELDKTINKQDSAGMSNLANSVEKVSQKFSAMGVAGMAAINRVVNAAFDAGERIVKALTIDPVKTGLEEYETKLNSIQVIKANTRGKNTMDQITDALDELNLYADKTIYNFAQMTSNVGKFVAQGLDVREAAKAVQGMANLAAASGASAEDMARATYQMSQALGGTIRKIDWNSLRNANMATVELKNTIMDVARNWGIAIDDIIAKKGTFEDSLEEGWLTGDLFTEAMNMYSDVYSEAQLKAKGYTDEQIANFKDLAKEANEAATKVKTITQLIDVAKESVQSGWTQTWEYILGDFNEASDFLTKVSQTFEFFSSAAANARNEMFKEWHDMGGRDELIQGLFDAFYGILQLVTPIKQAFQEIFPPMTAERLFNITKRFREIASAFTLTDDAAIGLKNATKLLLTPLKMVVNVAGQALKVAGVLGKVLWVLTNHVLGLMKNMNGFGSILERLIGSERYANLINAWNAALSKFGELLIVVLNNVFNFIRAVGDMPIFKNLIDGATALVSSGLIAFFDTLINMLNNFANMRFDIFNFDFSGIKSLPSFADIFANLRAVITNAKNSFMEFIGVTSSGGSIIQNVIGFFTGLLNKIAEIANKISLAKVAIVGFGVVMAGFMFKASKFIDSIAGAFESFGEIGESVSKFVKAMAFNEKSKGIMRVALAIGVLAASLTALAFVPKEGLMDALYALGIMSIALIGIATVMGHFQTLADSVKMSGTFVSLAASMLILVGAMKLLEDVTIDETLAQKLLVLAAAMTIFVGLTALLSKLSPQLASGSLMLVAFAYSTRMLAESLVVISDLNLSNSQETIRQLSILMVAIGAFLALGGRFKLSSALGIVTLCLAIDLITDTVNRVTDNIKIENITNALDKIGELVDRFVTFLANSTILDIAKIVVPMLAIAKAVQLVGMGISNIAKAIVKVSVSALIMFKALSLIGNMDTKVIAKGTETLKTILDQFTGLIAVFGVASTSIQGGKGSLSGMFKWFGKEANGAGDGMGAMIQLGKYASKLGTAMIKLSVAVGILVGVMKLMEYLDPEKMQTSLVAVTTLLSVFGVVALLSSFARKSAPIIALGFIVGALVTAVSLLSLIDTKDVLTACGSLSLVLLSLGLFTSTLGEMDLKKALSGILLLVGIATTVGAFITILTKFVPELFAIDTSKLLGATAAIALLATGLSAASALLSKAKFKENEDVLKSLASFFGVAVVMLPTIIALSLLAKDFFNLDVSKMIHGAMAIGILANTLASAALILGKVSYDDVKAVGRNFTAFLGIAGVMVGVAVLLGKFAKDFFAIDIKQMMHGAMAIGIIANAFSAAALVLSKAKFNDIKETLRSITAFAGVAGATAIALRILIPVFQKLSTLEIGKIASIAGAISVIALAIGGATAIMSYGTKFAKSWKEILASVPAILAFAGAIRILAPAFEAIGKLELKEIGKAIIGFAGTLAVLEGGLFALNKIVELAGPNFAKNMIKGLIALTALGADMWIFVTALKYLSEIKMDNMIAQLGGMAGALVILGGAVALLGKLPQQELIAGVLTLVAISGDLWILVGALEKFSTIDFGGWDKLAQSLIALGVTVGALGAFVAVMGQLQALNLALGVASLAAIGATLQYLLIPALAELASIDLSNLSEIIVYFVAIVGISSVVAAALGALSEVSLLGVLAFGAVGAILRWTFAPALDLLSQALERAVPALDEFSKIDMIRLAAGMVALSVGAGLLSVGCTLLLVGAIGVLAFASSLYVLAGALEALGSVMNTFEWLQEMFTAGANAIGKFTDGLGSGIEAIYNKAHDAIAGFVNGIADSASNMWNAGVNAAASFINGFSSKEGIDSHSPSIKMAKKAHDSYTGFANENSKLQKSYFKEGEKSGKSYTQGVENAGSNDAPKTANNIAEKYAEQNRKNAERYKKIGQESGGYIVSGTSESLNKGAGQTIDAFVDELLGEFGEKSPEISNYIKNKLNGILGGINIGDAPIKDWINRNLNVTGLINDAKDALGLNSETSPFSDITDKVSSGLDNVGSSAKGAGGSAAAAKDEFESLRDTLSSSLDSFDKFDKGAKESGSRIIMNLKSQFDGMAEWADMIAQMTAKGFDEKIIKKFVDQGVSSYSKVSALLKSTPMEVQMYNRLINAAVTYPDDILQKLKSALPKTVDEVAKATKKTTDQVGKSSEKIEKTVENTTKSIQDDVKDTTETLTKETKEVEEVEKDLAEVAKDTTDVIDEQSTSLENLTEVQNGVTDSTQQMSAGLVEAADDAKTLSGGVLDLQGALDVLGTISDEVKDQFIYAFIEMKAKVEELGIAVHDSVESQMDLFKEFEKKTELTSDQLLSNMRSQIAGINEWASMMASLGGKLDVGLMQKLAELGPDGYEYVHAFVTMTDEQLKEANSLYQQGLLLPDAAANKVMASYQQAGYYVVEGFVAGLTQEQQNALDTLEQFGLSAIDAFNLALGVHSPSKKTFESGQFTIIGAINGMTSKADALFTYVKYVAEKVVRIMSDGLDPGNFYVMGQNIVSGLIDGVESRLDALEAVIDKLTDLVESTTRINLKIHSPSQVMNELGGYVGIGMAEGIANMAYKVRTAVSDLSDETLNAMRDTINTVANVLEVDMDSQPTIRPVIDLSEVQNGASYINSLMNMDGTIGIVQNTGTRFHAQDATVTTSPNNTYDGTNVVNAIIELRTDITALGDRMAKMQVVLDSGSLVGEMTPQLNSSLGQQRRYSGRRM